MKTAYYIFISILLIIYAGYELATWSKILQTNKCRYLKLPISAGNVLRKSEGKSGKY